MFLYIIDIIDISIYLWNVIFINYLESF